MCLYVVKLIFHDFIQFSKKRPSIKTSLIRFNFIKLPIRCMLNLAAILRRKVCRFHQDSVLILKAAETFINFTVISMQIVSHRISFKVASLSLCYLTNGHYMRYLFEKLTRENKVIAAVNKWNCFQICFK